MGAFEKFPYTNFHDLNLDWIMRKIKSLEEKISNISPTDVHDVPAGGAKGQVLSKASGEDYDVAWGTIEIPETHDLPTGGTTGQVLTKSSNADYATEWKDAEKATEYTLPVATTADLGGIKAAVDSVPDSNTRCGIEVESDGTAYASVPKAATDSYGLVKAGAATTDDTQEVHIDSTGKLVTKPGSSVISSGTKWSGCPSITCNFYSSGTDVSGKTFIFDTFDFSYAGTTTRYTVSSDNKLSNVLKTVLGSYSVPGPVLISCDYSNKISDMPWYKYYPTMATVVSPVNYGYSDTWYPLFQATNDSEKTVRQIGRYQITNTGFVVNLENTDTFTAPVVTNIMFSMVFLGTLYNESEG